MEVRGIGTPRLEWTGDCLVIGLFEDAIALTEDLAELIAETEFKLFRQYFKAICKTSVTICN